MQSISFTRQKRRTFNVKSNHASTCFSLD